jgi:hypothetical protein
MFGALFANATILIHVAYSKTKCALVKIMARANVVYVNVNLVNGKVKTASVPFPMILAKRNRVPRIVLVEANVYVVHVPAKLLLENATVANFAKNVS